jgi:hypothetical protein
LAVKALPRNQDNLKGAKRRFSPRALYYGRIIVGVAMVAIISSLFRIFWGWLSEVFVWLAAPRKGGNL